MELYLPYAPTCKAASILLYPFCDEYDRLDLALDDEEWQQIDYLLWITQPFFEFTTELSKTKDITTHYVFEIYNKHFEHFEQSSTQLQRKWVPWKKNMLQALEAAQQKLRDYYSETDNIQGDLYAICTMLAPANKLQFFQSNEWDENWARRYRQSFEDYLVPYKARLSDPQASPPFQTTAQSGSGSRLNMILKGSKRAQSVPRDELTQYLDGGMY